MDAIYARQSVEKRDSISIESQIATCRKHVQGEFMVYKESKSGKDTQREEFQRMMQDIRDGLVRRVIVYRLDRISRSLMDFCSVWEEFKRYDVRFLSCNEAFDTGSPIGEAMIKITMIFAEMERNTIVERVTDNYFARAKEGFFLGGYAPFGYVKVDIEHKGKKTAGFIPDNNTAQRLVEIFEQYANTKVSIGKLAEHQTLEGVTTGRGSNWTSSSLGRVLRSPIYVKANAEVYSYLKAKGATMNQDVSEYMGVNGCYTYSKQVEHTAEEKSKREYKKKKSSRKFTDLTDSYVSLAPHIGLISPSIWLACQYKLDNNKQVKSDRSGTHTWLSGLMRCGYCGFGISVVNNNRGNNYINCYGRKLHVCDGRKRAWKLEEIEAAAEFILLNELSRLRNINVSDIVPAENPKVNELRQMEAKLDKRRMGYYLEIEQAYEDEQPQRIAGFRSQIDKCESELNKVLQEITRLINEDNNRRNSAADSYDLGYIVENWSDLDMESKKAIAKIFIEHVVVAEKSSNTVDEETISVVLHTITA